MKLLKRDTTFLKELLNIVMMSLTAVPTLVRNSFISPSSHYAPDAASSVSKCSPTPVRETEFKIGVRGTSQHYLVTGGVQTCIAFMGVHQDKGVVFLCHINNPFGIKEILSRIEESLKSGYELEIKDFTLTYAGGLRPFIVSLILSALIAPLPILADRSNTWQAVIVFFTLLVVGTVFFGLKVLGLWWALKKLGIENERLEFLGYTHSIPILFRCKVTADANEETILPTVECYCNDGGVNIYAAPNDRN